MPKYVKYYLVSAAVLPDVILRAAEVNRMMEAHEAETVEAAARAVGISRSAYYKYKDTVRPFFDMKSDRIITFQAILKDVSGVLSRVLAVFATSGANILTINQSVPVNGCAAVNISAEVSGLAEEPEQLISNVRALEGVIKFEILAG
ncbi:MAG: ACT domain-containing protein [Oscillibacter sp.]|nr:ACT domain-containing protein [Oscillibacter sp.]